MNNYITYGYCLVDGTMETNPEQSASVHAIFDAYNSGDSIKQIVRMMKDREAPSTYGACSWTPSLIRKTLCNQDYLGTEIYSQMIEKEVFTRVQERLQQSRDLWNQRHPSGSLQGTSMYTGKLFCSRCGGVYSIYKQSKRDAKKKVRYWKCRHYDGSTKEPCRMPIMTEKQLNEMFLQFLMRLIAERNLYQEKNGRLLLELAAEKQRMESELDAFWNSDARDYARMEELYVQIASKRYQEIKIAELTHQIEKYLQGLDASNQADVIDSSVFQIIKRVEILPDRSMKFELANKAVIIQPSELKKREKKLKNIRYCVPFGYWLDDQGTPIIHEAYGFIIQMLFQAYIDGMSLTALAKELERRSIPNQKGAIKWSHSCIRNILTNQIYQGNDTYPALVPMELFNQVQARLDETSRLKRETRTQRTIGKEREHAESRADC